MQRVANTLRVGTRWELHQHAAASSAWRTQPGQCDYTPTSLQPELGPEPPAGEPAASAASAASAAGLKSADCRAVLSGLELVLTKARQYIARQASCASMRRCSEQLPQAAAGQSPSRVGLQLQLPHPASHQQAKPSTQHPPLLQSPGTAHITRKSSLQGMSLAAAEPGAAHAVSSDAQPSLPPLLLGSPAHQGRALQLAAPWVTLSHTAAL